MSRIVTLTTRAKLRHGISRDGRPVSSDVAHVAHVAQVLSDHLYQSVATTVTMCEEPQEQLRALKARMVLKGGHCQTVTELAWNR